MQMWSHPSAPDESDEQVMGRRDHYAAAGNVFDCLSRSMQLAFFQRLLSCGECNTKKILEILANIAMQTCPPETTPTVQAGATEMRLGKSRHITERAARQLAINRAVITAMDTPVSPDAEYYWQEKARFDARAKIEKALQNIDAAERELVHTHNQLQRARDSMSDRMLSDSTLSVQRLAKHAAKAQELLSELLNEFANPKPDAAKKAERTVRDIVMLCCRAQAGIKDRNGFLDRAAEAYEVQQITKEVKAQLMLSYSKHEDCQRCGFPSNNAYNNDRNGPRTGRNKEPDDTSGSAYTARVWMSVEKTINQDQQQGKREFKNEFGEAMHANQETSCQANDEWKTVPNYATPGQAHVDDQTFDIHCTYEDPTHLQQLAEFHLQAQQWHMEQSIWYANEHQAQTEEELLTFWVVDSQRMGDTPACDAHSSVLL